MAQRIYRLRKMPRYIREYIARIFASSAKTERITESTAQPPTLPKKKKNKKSYLNAI